MNSYVGGKPDASPTTSAGSDSKRKVKLRERTGGPQKDRITAIGKFPQARIGLQLTLSP